MSNLSITERDGKVIVEMTRSDYETLITGFRTGAEYVERHEDKIRTLPFKKRTEYLKIKELSERLVRYARLRFFGEN